MHSIAFTGHRKIGRGDSADILVGFSHLHRNGVNYYPHTGGAVGFDTLVYRLVAHVPNMLHVPFEYQREELSRSTVDDLYVVNTEYCDRCPSGLHKPQTPADNRFYQLRNQHMVDLADEVICYWNGIEKGGTWNTIRYARKVGKPVRDIREL